MTAIIAPPTPTAELAAAIQLVRVLEHGVNEGDDDNAADSIGELAIVTPTATEAIKPTFSQSPLAALIGPMTLVALRRLG